MAPLILTLQLDDVSFQYFDRQRKAYFPPERSFLDAHLTLFHHLPQEEPGIRDAIVSETSEHAPISLDVAGLRFLGNGVAYKLKSTRLSMLHKQLQECWKQWLIPQDRQGLRPHVTVQNKVASEKARSLYAELTQSFIPFVAIGKGLCLWEYLGGPWKQVEYFPFAVHEAL